MLKSVTKQFEYHWIVQNANCWIIQPEPCQEPFQKAIIISSDELLQKAKIKELSTNKIIELKYDQIFQRSDQEQTCDDMVNLQYLNEAELLSNLQRRFIENDIIFTYVGPTLLIINPYKQLDELFSISNLATYQKQVNNIAFTLKDFKPHIFAISADVFRKLFDNKLHQAIIISGESGAGKTENVKYAMKFLTSLGNVSESKNFAKDMFKKDSTYKRLSVKKEAIEEKILSCNPILEAFGNAKTLRNDNSSRFGKYVTLLINKDTKKIVGAKLLNYLLEKSRITNQTTNERNYHIFYHLLSGGNKYLLEEIGLIENGKKLGSDYFNYLNKSGCNKVDTIDDGELFREVQVGLEITGFSHSEKDCIWKLVASILFLGNLEFEDPIENESSCQIKNEEFIDKAVEMLKIDKETLIKAFLLKTREIGKQIIESPVTRQECYFSRDSITKDLYERLFNWIVKKLNYILSENSNVPNPDYYQIGLLDIFGFECFAINSFEQLCINYTNEKLQQLYISYVFKAEKEEFILEGLSDFLCELNYKDNQPVIDLLEQSALGIFNLLDESCAVAGDDEKLLGKIKLSHKNNLYFGVNKINKDTFIIKHSAKDVEYTIQSFRMKNKDEVPKSINLLFENSKSTNVKLIFFCAEDEDDLLKIHYKSPIKSSSASNKFLSSKFRDQMKELMTELKFCECHFIRCLKANDIKKANIWMPNLVLQQIKYLGVLESIKVRKESFPIRRPYKLFYERYDELADPKDSYLELNKINADFKFYTKKMIDFILKDYENEIALYGEKKIFLKNPTYGIIENIFQEKIKIKNFFASKIQKAFFRFKQMKKLRAMFRGLKKAKSLWRAKMDRNNFKKMRKCAKKIQGWILKKKKIKEISDKRFHILNLQNYVKRYVAYKQFNLKELRIKIIKIQRLIRRFLKKLKILQYKFIREIIIIDIFELFWNKVMISKIIKIQKTIRMFLSKSKNKDIVLKIKTMKQNFLLNKSAIKIQKFVRGNKLRNKYSLLKKSTNKIKAFFKMRWLSTIYNDLKKATLIIQRYLKPFIDNKIKIRDQLSEFILEKELNKKTRKNYENYCLFDENPNLFEKNDFSKSGEYKIKEKKSMIKKITPYTPKSIDLFVFILDIDITVDPTEIYPTPWSQSYLNLYFENMNSDSDLQYILAGDSHTLAINNKGHTYGWGWNDTLQIGNNIPKFDLNDSIYNINTFPDGFNIKAITTGDTHNICIDYNNNVFGWGDNYYQQINKSKSLVIPTPQFLFRVDEGIKEIKSRGHMNYIVTEKGNLITWPEKKSGKLIFTQDIFINIYIISISCSYHFCMILSKSGNVYSMGSENYEGELGVGDRIARFHPTLIDSFQNEKIQEIECGYRHTICKTTLGKVYTWGWGKRGQLGHGSFTNELRPKLVSLSNKILQIQASYESSLALTEDKKVYWWGSNGSLKNLNSPKEINFKNKNKEIGKSLDLLPVRLISTWSKTTSIIWCTIADTRNIQASHEHKNKILNILNEKWANSSIYNIHPPLINSISNFFGSKFMKINQITSIKKKLRNKNSVSPDLNEEKKNVKFENNYYDTKEKIDQKKLKELEKRMEDLGKISPLKWNETDYQFMKIVTNQNMKSLFKDL